jgi:ABC-type nitrate/sulfonate/bicarbonate transport system permease component
MAAAMVAGRREGTFMTAETTHKAMAQTRDTARRVRSNVPGMVGIGTALALWQLVVTAGVFQGSAVPGPVDVVQDAILVTPPVEILADAATSLGRVLAGCAVGGVLGTAAGIVTGWSKGASRWATAPLEILRPIPPLAWISLAILWFGLGEGSRIFIIAVAAFFPLYTSAQRATAGIDPSLVHAGRTFGLRGWRLLAKIALPAALPDIATGLRIAWGLAFGALVAAEIVAADTGLGARISDARQMNDIPQIVYGILLIGALTLLTDYLLRVALRRSLRWAPST